MPVAIAGKGWQTRSLLRALFSVCYRNKRTLSALVVFVSKQIGKIEAGMAPSDLLVGPLIERGGRFCYDIFSSEDGLKSSFLYRRIEEARHDRRSFLAEVRHDKRRKVRVCETLAEFLRLVERAPRRPRIGGGPEA